jgi:hypothetical protein
MAGRAFLAIDVIDLSRVRGGVDKQTRALQLAIAQVTSAVESIAKAAAPSGMSAMLPMLLSMLSRNRSGAGPTPAPALPPTSTLTR